MPPRSKFWKHFTRIDKDHAKCNECPNHTVRTPSYATSGLKTHLDKNHHDLYLKLLAEDETKKRQAEETAEEFAQANSSKAKRPKSQATEPPTNLFNNYIKYNLQDPKQLKWDLEIMTLLALENLPFSFVETPGFKRLITFADPKVNIKSATTFSKRKLPLLYDNVKGMVDKDLKKDLPDCEGLGFSTDLWTSRNNDPYQAVTIHYITTHFLLKKFLLGCFPFPGNHKGERIARKLDQIVSVLDLHSSTVTSCVTDQGANMIKAVEKSVLDNNILCNDHIIHLIVTDSIKKVPCIQIAVDKCVALASNTHRSSINQGRIQKECEDITGSNLEEVVYRKIITPCSTRWNSQHMCVESIISMKTALLSIKEGEGDDALSALIPSEEDFESLEGISQLLNSLHRVSEALSADKVPTIHLVCQHIFNVSHFIQKFVDEELPGKELAVRLLEEINRRLPQFGAAVPMNAMAHFLDPIYRGSVLTTVEGKWKETRELFIDSNPETPEILAAQSSFSANESYDEFNACDIVFQSWSQSNPNLGSRRRQVAGKLPIEVELDKYEQIERPQKQNFKILEWWKANATMFPLLSQFARNILCIPASSSSSERVFSQSGNIVSNKRTKLDPKMLRSLSTSKKISTKLTLRPGTI